MITRILGTLTCLLGLYGPAAAEVVDLKPTPMGKRLEADIKNAVPKVGNDGEVNLTKLTFDTETNKVEGEVKVKIKHSWGGIGYKDYTVVPPKNRTIEAAVSAEGSGQFIFNVENVEVAVGVVIPLGKRSVTVLGRKYEWDFGEVKIPADVVERVLDGDLVATLETIPNLGTTKKQFRNEYEKIKKEKDQEYGAGNVYFSSKRFVDEVKPTTAFNTAVSLIVTAGASSEAIMKHVADLTRQEGNDILIWLKQRGIHDAEELLPALLEGKAVSLTDYYIAVNWQVVKYESRTLLLDRPVTRWIPENHGAFYIVIRKRGGPEQRPNGSDPASPTGGQPGNSPGVANPPEDPTLGILKVRIVNKSSMTLRIKSTRFSNNDPVVFSHDLKPGTQIDGAYFGGSTRGFTAWKLPHGQLVSCTPIPIFANTIVTYVDVRDGDRVVPSVGSFPP